MGCPNAGVRNGVIEHLRHPQAHTPDSVMPSYPLSAPEMDRLVTYLFSVPQIKPFSMVQLTGIAAQFGQSKWMNSPLVLNGAIDKRFKKTGLKAV